MNRPADTESTVNPQTRQRLVALLDCGFSAASGSAKRGATRLMSLSEWPR